jgi:hypothetical protein
VIAGLAASIAAKAASPEQQIAFRCAGGRFFTLRIAGASAAIDVDGRTIILRRKPSSIGLSWQGEGAALIVDGDYAALVLDDDPNWLDCRS